MSEEAIPIRINGEDLFLRFEDSDIDSETGGIETSLSLFVAFHPSNMTYSNAALFLWKGLRRKDDQGNLTYSIQQGPPGKKLAKEYVRKFCAEMPEVTGMIVLYGYYAKALVASGWIGKSQEGKPDDETSAKPLPKERDPKKNSVQPTGRLRGILHSVCVTLRTKRSGGSPPLNSMK
jgi:hypothetical protein